MDEQSEIIEEIINAISDMGEPERTEYIKKHFIIARKGVIKKRLFRDPRNPGAYKEHDVIDHNHTKST